MKLLAKKVKGLYGNRKSGFIQPIFEINGHGELRSILKNEYLNNGYIFINDYDLLDSHIESTLISIDNGFFINEDIYFSDKSDIPNASQKRINYNEGISTYFTNVPPHIFIPIHNNRFNIDKHRLIDIEGIVGEIFFLRDNSTGFIYGPFERDNYDLKPATYKNYDYESSSGSGYRDFLDGYSEYDGSVIFKIDGNVIKQELIKDSDEIEYIIDFEKVVAMGWEVIEYTPISILHKWVIEKLHSKGFKFIDYVEDIKNIEKLLNSPIDKLKWEKYLNFITQTEERDIIIEELINRLNEKGYVENSQKLNDQKELLLLEETVSIKDQEIIKLKDERKTIEIELKEIKSKEKEFIDDKKYPNLALTLHNPELLGELETIITNKQDFSNIKDELNRLEGEKNYLSKTIKESEETKRQIVDSIRQIKQTWDNDLSYHSAKLADAKMYTDLLNGININPKDSHDEVEDLLNISLSDIPQEINSAKLYINEIQKRLKKLNRELPFNEVANLVVTINQSFLTIIAGAPGVGKTSLVSKLAKAYGLNEKFGYLEVNCSRGWTSSRDLLGFYNPLTGRYQDSKTKLRYALKQSSEFIKAPYLVLLDEANLSPLEHYWSDFIKLADSDYSRKIKIYDKEEIHFGEGFKFIATINHDHTTEALSNRLIDRAAIVQLEKPLLISDSLVSDEEIYQIFDFFEIQRLFPETLKWKSDEELIKKLFQQIKDKIESNNSGIIISPRKEIAIKKYCKVMTGLMEGNSYTALDYAVSQHVLPLINGRGEQFEETLKGLKAELIDKGMSKSEKLLSKILDRGKDLKHFKYIYY